jgi:hypothetical protein
MCGCNAGGMCGCEQKDGKWFFKDGRVHARWERELQLEAEILHLKGHTKRFPIQNGPSIPWSVIEPHERQAVSNHDQDLITLAKRQGLSACEAVAVLEDREWQRMDPGSGWNSPAPKALARLAEIVEKQSALTLGRGELQNKVANLENRVAALTVQRNKYAGMVGIDVSNLDGE